MPDLGVKGAVGAVLVGMGAAVMGAVAMAEAAPWARGEPRLPGSTGCCRGQLQWAMSQRYNSQMGWELEDTQIVSRLPGACPLGAQSLALTVRTALHWTCSGPQAAAKD